MNIKAEKIVYLTEEQAQFLDHLLWKEQQAKRKRGLKLVGVDYDQSLSNLKESIVDQMGIIYADEQLEYMEKIQGSAE